MHYVVSMPHVDRVIGPMYMSVYVYVCGF